MLLKLLRGRGAAVLFGLAAVAGLMVASVETVHAVVGQEQTEDEQKVEKERRARGEWRELLEKRLASAKALAGTARLRSSLGTMRALEGMRALGQAQGRIARAPRIELRSGRYFGGGAADRILAMGEELELTDQQRDSIRQARRAHRRAEIERDAEVEVIDLDLDELMEDRSTADLNAVEGLMMQRATLRVQAEIAEMRLGRQVMDSLTPEQKELFEESRGNMFMLRGDGPSVLFRRDGSADAWGHELNEVFEGLHLGEFGDFDFGDMTFDLHTEDGEPFVWRFHGEEHEGHDEDDDDGDKESTAGTAIGL
ncbi:MAG: hypothetical protein GKS06_08355 [Acidobacteria bacterium]|nr:hypothetical protein [Acidobacteriota bacterium]